LGAFQTDIIDKARSKFAINATKGIDFLIRHHLIEDSPEEIANFLQYCNFLDRTQIGEYLCDAYDQMIPSPSFC
jgi:Sec7-like guanine-nucleotide exchange factor